MYKILIFQIKLPEGVSLLYRTLCDEWYSVVILRASLPDTVPVNGDFHTFHMVLNIDDNFVIFAHLDGRSG